MRIQKIRFEPFGGIIGTEDPVSLLWVDREFLRSRGFDGRQAWEGPEADRLSRPVEMEITITTRCNLDCPCCYASSERSGVHAGDEQVTKAIEIASRMDVFHVAFGGGEPLCHPDLLRFAGLAREKGLVPAITTNGTLVTEKWARKAADLFGRVNVSVDLPGGPRDVRVGLADSLRAVRILRDAGITTGINFILTPGTMGSIDLLFREASLAGADSIMLLRPKPSGRGSSLYERMMLDTGRQKSLLPLLLELEEGYDLPFHLDCAFAPVLMRAGATSDSLRLLGAYGCIAGDLLVTVDIQGFVRPCSHLEFKVCRVQDLPAVWTRPELWGGFRDPSPVFSGRCSSCPVAELCRGGCAAVKFWRGLSLPDPDPDVCCEASLSARS